MFDQYPSTIYKSQLRGHYEDENYRCLSSFNFEKYFDENRKPFGNLRVLNDETLASKQAHQYSVTDEEFTMLIPLVGTIEFIERNNNHVFIDTEQILISQALTPTTFEIKNPYETELVNYLQIRCGVRLHSKGLFEKIPFNFDLRNQLFTLFDAEEFRVSIGIFSGRTNANYVPKTDLSGVFAFVIGGAFEFENRLIESRDGLSIRNISEIEFEALSENALLLVIETSCPF